MVLTDFQSFFFDRRDSKQKSFHDNVFLSRFCNFDFTNFTFLQVPQVVLPLIYQAMVNPLTPTGPTSRVRTRGSSRWTRCQKRAPTRARTPTPTMASVTPPRPAPPQPHQGRGPRDHPHQIQHQGQVGYGGRLLILRKSLLFKIS